MGDDPFEERENGLSLRRPLPGLLRDRRDHRPTLPPLRLRPRPRGGAPGPRTHLGRLFDLFALGFLALGTVLVAALVAAGIVIRSSGARPFACAHCTAITRCGDNLTRIGEALRVHRAEHGGAVPDADRSRLLDTLVEERLGDPTLRECPLDGQSYETWREVRIDGPLAPGVEACIPIAWERTWSHAPGRRVMFLDGRHGSMDDADLDDRLAEVARAQGFLR